MSVGATPSAERVDPARPRPRALRRSLGPWVLSPNCLPARETSSARTKRRLDAAGTPLFAGALPRSADGDRTLDLLRTTETVATTTKEPICRDFQAADGTRTHDLLHGNKNLIRCCAPLLACKLALFRPQGPLPNTPRFRPIPGFSEPFPNGAPRAVCLPRRRPFAILEEGLEPPHADY